MITRRTVLLAWAIGCSSVVAAAVKPAVPRLEVNPRLSAFNPNGVPVRFQVKIAAPKPELSCPEVSIEWPDGTHSVTESDCAACEKEPCPDFEAPARWRRFGPGEFVIKARVRQGKKTVVLSETVSIVGGE